MRLLERKEQIKIQQIIETVKPTLPFYNGNA
jgi:hypothetical protein